MGALVSFELARCLRQQQLLPAQLFVSAARAPQLGPRGESMHQLPPAMFIERLRRLNGTPKEVLSNVELLHLLLPVLRADFELCETYQYGLEEPLACGISAFGGLQDRDVARDDLAAWRVQTCSTFNLRMLLGDHFFITTNRKQLLQLLANALIHLLHRSTSGARL
jgi:medium-chain acyl-[acyl-carrier-protein] hydrolase